MTPNIPEAELLLGRRIQTDDDAERALAQMLAEGARAVLLKGGHLPGEGEMTDRFGHGQHPRRTLPKSPAPEVPKEQRLRFS